MTWYETAAACCEVDNVMEMSHLKYFVLFKTIAGEKVAILRHEMIILPLLNLQGGSPTQPAWEVAHKKMQLKIHQNIFIQLLFCVST